MGMGGKTPEELHASRVSRMQNKMDKLIEAQCALQEEYDDMHEKLNEIDARVRAAQSKISSFRTYCA